MPGKYCQPCVQTSWHALMRLYPPPWSSRGLQVHPTTDWLSPITALPGSYRPQEPVFPEEYSCLHLFLSLVHLWPPIVTQLTWLQAGRASFPLEMHAGRWCTSQTQPRLCTCARVRYLQHPSPPAGSWHGGARAHTGHGGLNFPHFCPGRSSQAQRENQRENLLLVVCDHGRGPWDFCCPAFTHGGHTRACTPQHLQSSSSNNLQCPFPSQGHGSFLLLLSPNSTGWSRVHPCQNQTPQWQGKHQ